MVSATQRPEAPPRGANRNCTGSRRHFLAALGARVVSPTRFSGARALPDQARLLWASGAPCFLGWEGRCFRHGPTERQS
jgi:hypothetical protein